MIQLDLFNNSLNKRKIDNNFKKINISNYIHMCWDVFDSLGINQVKTMTNKELKRIVEKKYVVFSKTCMDSFRGRKSIYLKFEGNYKKYIQSEIKRRYKSKYNLSFEEYNQLKNINLNCSICGCKLITREHSKSTIKNMRCIDHDENDKKNKDDYFIRGIICSACNNGNKVDNYEYMIKRFIFLRIYDVVKERLSKNDFFEIYDGFIKLGVIDLGWNINLIFKFHETLKELIEKRTHKITNFI